MEAEDTLQTRVGLQSSLRYLKFIGSLQPSLYEQRKAMEMVIKRGRQGAQNVKFSGKVIGRCLTRNRQLSAVSAIHSV